MAMTSCRHFSGYKPCQYSGGSLDNCTPACGRRDIPRSHLLIIHLGALGAVARSTSLLAPIRRKYPSAKITWVTDKPAQEILKNNPAIDRVLTTDAGDLLSLEALIFDAAFCIDKSLKAAGVLAKTRANRVFGFQVDARTGTIVPATEAARELWRLGLNDHEKFHVNTKPETRLMVEALELGGWRRDNYDIPLSPDEEKLTHQRRSDWRRADGPIVGLNTGSSNVIPMKKWTVEYQRELIRALHEAGHRNIVLLGGPEDRVRNERIAYGLPVIQSPTTRGLRDGLVSVDACDIVISGDSLGMHLAIARNKFVVAWFGPTCAHEIDLYDRGIALKADVTCGPCWKRSCQKNIMCYDRVSIADVLSAVERGKTWGQKEIQMEQPERAPSEQALSVLGPVELPSPKRPSSAVSVPRLKKMPDPSL